MLDPGDQGSALDGHETTDQRTDERNTGSSRWRRVLSAENVSAVSTIGGAADTAVQLFGPGTVGGGVGLGFTVLGVAGMGMARADCQDRGDQVRQR